ncbi:MAG: UvrD-helicase domain-containing protein [Clostridia bacterium]|nr:UvrD-helicase domain-containing protein [Clostridia bacterium]
MEYLTALNEKQQEAVLSTEGYLRVIAGAGSGKTKLLVSRYAYLVKEYGIDSSNILCVTFTNKAAGEMKRRIRALIGQEYDTSLICTYHGFCVRVLREDIEKIFYPKEFQIIDSAQQKSILGEIYQKFELKLDHASFEKILELIAKKKAERKYVTKMCCTEKCRILDQIHTLNDQIIEEYLQRQKQIYAMDFSDLMYFTLDIFDRCPDVLEKWQDRLNYIQVDEFQDSSTVEMELIDRLSAKYQNLMIVGDPDQNIYEWRGSDVKLLVDFDKSHQPTQTIILNQNYRSTPQILRCANTLIAKNQFRLEKDLFTRSPDGANVVHFHTKSEFDEAEMIVENIRAVQKNSGCRFADFAVLYRSGFLSRIIEKKFTESGIPYEIYGGVKFYQRMEIQDIMAYLRLIVFDDDSSFKRIVNKPRRRFGRTKMQRLTELQEVGSLFETLGKNLSDPIFKNSGAAEFVAMIERLRAVYHTLPLSEIIEKICADTGYEKYIRELGDMERFENLSEFKRIADEYEKNFGEQVTLAEFINQISLQSEDSDEQESDMVKLMTIHAAKGLEFPNVFVVGFSEGIFPSAKTIEERKLLGLEEERRLCYVAITRAEQRLFLSDSEGFSQSGKQKLPSRFLAEIGEENYVRIGVISKELQQESARFVAGQSGSLSQTSSDDTLGIGSAVIHPAFGPGEIVGYGKNQNTYRIRFEKLSQTRDISADFFRREHGPLPTLQKLTEKNDDVPSPEPAPTPLPELISSDPFISSEPYVPTEPLLPLTPPEPASPIAEPNIWEMPSEASAEETNAEEMLPIEEIRVEETKQREDWQEESAASSSRPKRPDTKDYENLWERDDVPKSGWVCTGITDLGEPVGVCQMCGHQIIRYVHHMIHPNYPRSLGVGCVCAGKMEGDIEGAKKREQEFKNKQSRLQSFLTRKWKVSRNFNSYLKIKDHLIVLYQVKGKSLWKFSLDNVFGTEVYKTKEDCQRAAFEALELALK